MRSWPVESRLVFTCLLAALFPAAAQSEVDAAAPCAFEVAAGDPIAADRRITAGPYRCVAVLRPPSPELVPIGAALVDRDGDGNRELAIAYRGEGSGTVVWRAQTDGVLAAAEPPQRLDFAPAEMIGGDLDGDGRDELLFASADLAELVVARVESDGRPTLAMRAATPGRAAGLVLSDHGHRDGLVELRFTTDGAAGGRWQAGGVLGALPELAASRWLPVARERVETGNFLAEMLLSSGRLNRDAHPELLVRLDDGSVGLAELVQAVVVVNSTSEAVDFGGLQQIGDLPGADGLLTLREALIAANNTSGADVVQFNIPSTGNDCHDGACWFTPSDGEAGALPPISVLGGAVTLDGYTQTANRGDTNPDGPELVLDGVGQTGGNGLVVQAAAASSVIDFVVQNFDDAGILGIDADGLVLQGNYLGTNLTGTGATANARGVFLNTGTANALIGGPGTHGVSPAVPNRNLISGNVNEGILISDDGTSNNDVQANRIGTNRSGNAALANSLGVVVREGADANRIGATTAGAGNLISGQTVFGVELVGVEGTLVQGNFIGTNVGGLGPLPNAFGIRLQEAATGNTIGGTTGAARNLISGNTNHGVSIADAGTDANLIRGNWIGLDATGAAALPNDTGIFTGDDIGTVVGGAVAGAGNVISGNLCGVCTVDAVGLVVRGNRFGTDATGAVALAVSPTAVHVGVDGDGAEIGGGAAGEGNQFAGTLSSGVLVSGAGSSGNRIRGNTFGLDAAGTATLGSLAIAIRIENGPDATEVGGPTLAERNWIAAAGFGLRILGPATTGTLVRGNAFGRSPAASGPQFGNTVGIDIEAGAVGSVIGGSGGAANEIRFSTQAGIRIVGDASLGHRITRNSIVLNGALGIDLAGDQVTPNDAGDGDTGPNARVNWPVLTSAVNICGSGLTTVTGTLDSPTPSPDQGLVELFSSAAPDPSGNGEGETFGGQTTPAFNGAISTVVPAQPTGSWMTSTYTDDDDNTSEFGNALQIVTTPLAPGNLDAELAAGPAIELDWADNATDETGFRIERRAAGDAFALLANVAANQTSHTDNGPFATGTTYYYRVRAESSLGCQSGWSNIASAIVPAATTAFCRRRATHHESAANPYAEAAGPGQFGVTWRETDDDAASLYYARLDSTGATVGAPVLVHASTEQAIGQTIAWSGDRWGMVWYERLGDRFGLFFETFDLQGNLLSGPIAVSEPAGRPIVNQLLSPGFAWDGQGWGIAWPDIRNGFTEIRYTHVSADGRTKETADVLVNDNSGSASAPRLAWTGTHHAIVWFDLRTASLQIYSRRLARDGTPAGASVAATTTGVISFQLTELRWDGAGELGLVWLDERDGDVALFFRRLSTAGAPLSPETRISDPPAVGIDVAQMALRRTGTRWVVAAEDFRQTNLTEEIFLSFADLNGAKLGSDVLLTTPLDTFYADDPAIAWDGAKLLVTWHGKGAAADSLELHAQTADETGNQGADPRRLVTSGHAPAGVNRLSAIETLGNGFAVAWDDPRAGNGSATFLRMLGTNGQPVASEIHVPDLAISSTSTHLSLAWSGEVLAVLWQSVGSNAPTLGFFDGTGVKLRPDVEVPMASSSGGSDVHWTGDRFLVAFEKAGAPDHQEIHVAAYLPDGTLASGPHRISVGSGRSMQPALAGGGGARAVAWRDVRDGNGEIYAAALDASGMRMGPEIRLTTEGSDQNRPALAWNGAQFGLAWTDNRTGQSEVRFRRLLADATATGAEIQLSNNLGSRPSVTSDGAGWGIAYGGFLDPDPLPGGLMLARVDAGGSPVGTPRLAIHSNIGVPAGIVWDGARYVVAGLDVQYFAGELSVKSSACVLDSTPPSCPSGLTANAEGQHVTLAWTPAADGDFEIERQILSRDGSRIAALSAGVSGFVDPEVRPGVAVYSVGALNQGYLEATGCASVEVDVPLFEDGFESGNTTAWSATVPGP